MNDETLKLFKKHATLEKNRAAILSGSQEKTRGSFMPEV